LILPIGLNSSTTQMASPRERRPVNDKDRRCVTAVRARGLELKRKKEPTVRLGTSQRVPFQRARDERHAVRAAPFLFLLLTPLAVVG
jgi:hypothetical protein